MLIVSIFQLRDLNSELYKLGPDVIELRLDLFQEDELIEMLNTPLNVPIPILVAIKPNFQKKELIPHLLKQLNPAYVDLDFTLFHRFEHMVKTTCHKASIIVSKHSKNLYDIKSFYKKFPQADFKKLVIETNNILTSLHLAYTAKKNQLILFTQGEKTSFTRFFSSWHYCFYKNPTAKGQYCLSTLKSVFSKTHSVQHFLCLIGDPVCHSISHITHNITLKKFSSEWIYIKIPLKHFELKKGLYFLQRLGCLGLSITTPHKIKACQILKKSSLARGINTWSFTQKQSRNTDAEALESLLSALPRNSKILLLGNGACSIAFQYHLKLNQRPYHLWTRKSPILVHDEYDVIINATSCEDPLKNLPRCRMLINLYHHKDHPVIEEKARNQGSMIVSGMDFFFMQAGYQLEFLCQKKLEIDKHKLLELVKELSDS